MNICNNDQFISFLRPEPNNWEKDCFGIPFIEKEELPISDINSTIFLINPNNVSIKDTDKKER